MQNEVVQYLQQHIQLTAEEASAVKESIPVKTFKKGTFLLKVGEVARDAYAVFEGLVRQYFLSNGEEKTTSFFIEGEGFADLTSINQQTPSKYYFCCVEDCRLAVINTKKENQLYERFPKLEHLARIQLETMLAESQEKLITFVNSSPEERYLHLLQNRPTLLNRVPQYQIASYIGVAPESLSRIRKRVLHKKI